MSESIDDNKFIEDNSDKKSNADKNDAFRNDPTKIKIETNPVEIITGTAGFLKSILSLRNIKYDHETVMKSVQDGIEFKGYNVWILICSILIASVGLNIDSTAVVIGAMLISPLMGPIKGVGFGVGTNDFRLLLESLKNLGITVGISLSVAFLYFLISPIYDENSNLLSRTAPTFLDVIVAIFGGLAGVIAHTQGKNDTVIPGVAIATALMPPLCTAGYGLAIGNWGYFFGASYLFLLNSLLIAASAYFFIRYLKFPKKEYLTPKIDKRVRVYTWVFIIIAVAPSGYLFYKMTERSIFERNAKAFVTEVVLNADDNIAVTPTYVFDWKESKINLAITNFYADESTRAMWDRQKKEYGLESVTLYIQQDKDYESLVEQKLEDYDQRNAGANTLAQLLSQKENDLFRLQKKVDKFEELLKPEESGLKLDHLLAGFKIDYPEYQNIYINESYSLSALNQLDTNYIMSVEFGPNVDPNKRNVLNSRLSRRMKLELFQKSNIKQDSVRVITLN